MGTIRKLIYRCLCIEEEEESENLLSSDFHARSQLVSPLSAISSGKTTRFNDSLYYSYLSAEKKKATGKFSDTATKKVFSADSSASKEKLNDPKKQPSVDFSYTSTKKVLAAESSASKEKLICPKKQASVQFSDTTVKKELSADSSASKEKLIYPKKQEASVHLSDTAIKKVFSADSSASKEKLIDPKKQPSVDFSYTSTRKVLSAESSASKEKLINPSVYFYWTTGQKVSTSSTALKAVERKIQDYCSSQKILLVGEGDFSFSACLAKAFGSATNIVATSLNSEAHLWRHYRNARNNISQLRMGGCKVYHEVDATDIKNHKMIKGLRFDRIIYNFPHAGDFKSTEIALRANQLLVRLFMENCVKLIEEKGEIHIRHKSNWFFRQWNLEGLASEAGLVLIEEAPFDISEFKGYNTKYGFEGVQFRSDNNFDCHPSCTYKFVLSKGQKKLRRKENTKLSAYDTRLIIRT